LIGEILMMILGLLIWFNIIVWGLVIIFGVFGMIFRSLKKI